MTKKNIFLAHRISEDKFVLNKLKTINSYKIILNALLPIRCSMNFFFYYYCLEQKLVSAEKIEYILIGHFLCV